jgi:hypothetical protein
MMRAELGAPRAAPIRDGGPTVVALGFAFGLVVLAVARLLLFGWAEVAPDDARYVFVGLSTLNGHGPLTPSGNVFLLRSPVYGIFLAAWSIVAGGGPLAGARIVAALLTVSGLLAAVRLGWLGGGLVAAAGTALALLATPLIWNLLPTLRIDLPQTTGVLAVILALRRPTPRRWVLAGALFGLTVLVKETVVLLAFAPLAFVGVLPPARLARLWAGFLGAAALVAGWWWLVVWTQSGALFPLNAIGVIENRDVATVVRIDTYGAALMGVFSLAWLIVLTRARREPGARLLVLAAVALAPPTLYAAVNGLNARNDAGLAVLSAIAVGVAAARVIGSPAFNARIAGSIRLAGPATIAAAVLGLAWAGAGQARLPDPQEPALPGLIVDWLRGETPAGGRIVMTFRDAEIVGLELYGTDPVPGLAVVRVDPDTPLDQDLWLGLRDRQLFAYTRASWTALLGAPGTTNLVLAGPHPLTPVELMPSLDRGGLPGLVLGRQLAADGEWASIYRVEPSAVRAGPGDVSLHLSPAAAVAWLDLARGTDPSAAARRLVVSGAIVIGAPSDTLERRLAGVGCLVPMSDLGPDARRIEPTGSGCSGR